MADNTKVQPQMLDKHLPTPAPYGVVEWGFVLKTAQVTFVQIDEFEYPSSLYLKMPVVLGVRTDPKIELTTDPEVSLMFPIESADDEVLCTASVERQVGDVWHAKFFHGPKAVGAAAGTVGNKTPEQFIEAALIAFVRHAAARAAS